MANTNQDVINASRGGSQDPNQDDYQAAQGGGQTGTPTPTPTLPSGVAVYGNNSPAQVTAFETWLGRPVDLVLAFFNPGTKAAFAASATGIPSLQGGRRCHYSIPGCGSDDTMASVVSGGYDTIYNTCFDSILVAEPGTHGIVLRYAWEANIAGWGWSVTAGNEATYRAAWDRFAGLARAKSNRFFLEWNMNHGASTPVDPVDLYPNTGNPDVLSMDTYYTNGVDNSGSQGLVAYNFNKSGANRGYDWIVAFAASKGKPFSFTETGNNGAEFQRWNKREAGLVGGLYDFIRDNPSQYVGHWEGDHNGVSTRISNGDNPKIAALYKTMFGLPVIETTATQTKLAGSGATITLVCQQTATWTIVSGIGSIAGNILTIPAQSAGTYSITVRATTRYGTQTKVLNVQFAAAYSFVNAEASAYVARWSVAPDEKLKADIDTLIGAIKAAGGYTTAKDFYILLPGLGADSRLSVKNSAPTLTANGTETVNLDRGYTALASPASYLSTTGLNASAATPYVQNSACAIVYKVNDLASNSGAISIGGGDMFISPRTTADQQSGWANDFTNLNSANTQGRGIFAINRSAAATREAYRNGSLVANDTATSNAPTAAPFAIGASSVAFPDEHQIGFVWFGSSLNSTAQAAMATAIQNFADARGAPR